MTDKNKKIIEQINSGIIPEGYKKTKVGIVPTEWEVVSLNSVSTINPKPEKIDEKFLYIDLECVEKGHLKSKNIINIFDAPSRAQRVLKSNDILYQMVRPYQNNNYIYDSTYNLQVVASTGYAQIRTKYFNYIYHVINSAYFSRQVLVRCTGSNYPAINSKDLKAIKVTLPPLPEQQKIAEILSTQDKLIELYERKIEQLKMLKKGYLQKMFPKKGCKYPELRFKGFTDDWEQRKLGEVTQRVQGNDGRMSLPTLTISAGSGWLDQRDRFSANIAGKEQQNYTLLHKGELSYNHGNSKLAKYGTVFSLRTHEEALVPRVYHSFKVTEKADSDFIEYVFATKLPDKELSKLISSGARMDGLLNINYDEFMGIKIIMPSIEEQQQIGAYFRNLDNLITLHQHKLDKEKQKKKALMQLLLTGKVRVST